MRCEYRRSGRVDERTFHNSLSCFLRYGRHSLIRKWERARTYTWYRRGWIAWSGRIIWTKDAPLLVSSGPLLKRWQEVRWTLAVSASSEAFPATYADSLQGPAYHLSERLHDVRCDPANAHQHTEDDGHDVSARRHSTVPVDNATVLIVLVHNVYWQEVRIRVRIFLSVQKIDAGIQ